MAKIDDVLTDQPDGVYSFPHDAQPALVWKIEGQKLAIFINYVDNAVQIEFSGHHEWMKTGFPYAMSDILIPVLEQVINMGIDNE